MQNAISNLNNSLQKTNEWLNELVEIGGFHNKEQAYCVMRIILHKLRDSLTVDMVAHLAAQFPIVIAGVYYNSWHPANSPTHERNRNAFLQDINQKLRKVTSEVTAEKALTAVYGLLEKKLSSEMVEKIKHALPQELRDFWPSECGYEAHFENVSVMNYQKEIS